LCDSVVRRPEMAIHVVNKKTGEYTITLKPTKRTSAPASDSVISWLGDLKMAVHVVNKKTGGRGDYIGRPSIFGNPFVIGRDGSRADVIRKYRTWFWEQIEAGGALAKAFAKLVDRARAGEDINLVCW